MFRGGSILSGDQHMSVVCHSLGSGLGKEPKNLSSVFIYKFHLLFYLSLCLIGKPCQKDIPGVYEPNLSKRQQQASHNGRIIDNEGVCPMSGSIQPHMNSLPARTAYSSQALYMVQGGLTFTLYTEFGFRICESIGSIPSKCRRTQNLSLNGAALEFLGVVRF